MAQSVTRRIERSLTASAGFQSRPTDKASICGNHQGQRSCETAPKGRTHDCKRPVLRTKKTLATWGPSTHEAASLEGNAHPVCRTPYDAARLRNQTGLHSKRESLGDCGGVLDNQTRTLVGQIAHDAIEVRPIVVKRNLASFKYSLAPGKSLLGDRRQHFGRLDRTIYRFVSGCVSLFDES
jgi:hypothetical protein